MIRAILKLKKFKYLLLVLLGLFIHCMFMILNNYPIDKLA